MSDGNTALKKDFTVAWSTYNRNYQRGAYVRQLALAYQVTGDAAYAEKAREGLLYMDLVSSGTPVYNGWALFEYCMAYDWTQPYLNANDDAIIRDKLAFLADKTYVEVSTGTPNFADQNGQVYPYLGIAGVTLNDYTNPNGLSLSSMPDDWLTVGTDYLFVSDAFHRDGAQSLFAYGYDEDSGHYHNGAYKNYALTELIRWAQVYSHYFGTNVFDQYPALKRGLTAEVWDSLPNHYSSNSVTNGNVKYWYHMGIVNLLDDEWRNYVLNHVDIISSSSALPYSRSLGLPPADWFLYLVEEDYSAVERKYPDWTSYLGENYDFQVFRGSWNHDSDWLSLVTANTATGSNRDNGHHDQLGIEYYSRGDLLLADASENKNVLDRYYGYNPMNHNVVEFEDPRTPFPVSGNTKTECRGIFKGNSAGIATKIVSNNLVETPWMEMLISNVKVSEVVDDTKGSAYSKDLSSPIDYSRAILYPFKEYFVVIDRLEGTQSWIYRNVFRPTSLSITPSTGNDEVNVGHVNGNLLFDDTSYDWLSLPYNVETATGIVTNHFNWQTTNPYNDDVHFHLYTAPASEIHISKRVGRIAGYNRESEVFSPTIHFRTQPTPDLFRVTVLLSRYDSEEEKEAEEIAVTGSGNAIKVASTEYVDYAYAGKGTSTFESFATDADIAHMRMLNSTDFLSLTLIEGTFLRESAVTILQASGNMDFVTLYREEMKTRLNLESDSSITIALDNDGLGVAEVLKDGATFSDWSLGENGNVLIINAASGEHNYEIHHTEGTPSTPTRGDLNNNGEVDIGDVMIVQYMAAGLIEEDLHADFNENGYIDVGDAAKINYFYLGLIEEL